MPISLGEIIRRAVRDDHRSAKEICDALGMSRGNLDKIYKKDSINSDLLAKLCTTLNHDFFQYVNPFVLAERDGPRLYTAEDDPGERHTPMSRLNRCMLELHDYKREVDSLDRQMGLLKGQIADKDKIIGLQNEKIEQYMQRLADCRAGKDTKQS